MANNVTGWNELVQGKVLEASFKMYDMSLGGYFIVMLFMIFQTLVYIKSKSALLAWVAGALFLGLYFTVYSVGPTGLLAAGAMKFITLILVVELAGVMYSVFAK